MITALALVNLAIQGFSLLWLGVLLTTVPVLSLVLRTLLIKDPSCYLRSLNRMAYCAVSGCAIVFLLDNGHDIRPLLLASLSTIALVIYSLWLSNATPVVWENA